MTREYVKELLPVLQAFAEGKEIQIEENNGTWVDVSCIMTDLGYNYRIKPEPKYRPFKDAEECWQEMQKHQPFGWLREVILGEVNYHSIDFLALDDDGDVSRKGHSKNFKELFDEQTFADGSVFGIKEEGV